MIYPIGTRVRVREGATAIAYSVPPRGGVTADTVPDVAKTSFVGVVEWFASRHERFDPDKWTKVADDYSRYWIFRDEDAREWTEAV